MFPCYDPVHLIAWAPGFTQMRLSWGLLYSSFLYSSVSKHSWNIFTCFQKVCQWDISLEDVNNLTDTPLCEFVMGSKDCCVIWKLWPCYLRILSPLRHTAHKLTCGSVKGGNTLFQNCSVELFVSPLWQSQLLHNEGQNRHDATGSSILLFTLKLSACPPLYDPSTVVLQHVATKVSEWEGRHRLSTYAYSAFCEPVCVSSIYIRKVALLKK